MSSKPDPKKAIHLKRNQRRLPGQQKKQQHQTQWEPHRGDQALDAWGTALRDMRRAGTWPE